MHLFLADKNPQMVEFQSQIKSAADLTALFEQIQKDSNAVESTSPMEIN